jgi:adenylate kinase family enzyme
MAIIGPPGAGKSAQAKRVARSLPYHNRTPRFSSGELVRAEIEAGTELEREMEAYYARGERVPDEAILSLVLPRLRRSGGFVTPQLMSKPTPPGLTTPPSSGSNAATPPIGKP